MAFAPQPRFNLIQWVGIVIPIMTAIGTSYFDISQRVSLLEQRQVEQIGPQVMQTMGRMKALEDQVAALEREAQELTRRNQELAEEIRQLRAGIEKLRALLAKN